MNPKTILLAEDDPLIRRVSELALRREGFDVTAVADGADALERLEERLFDLVILDGMMPRIDGLEACRRIKASPRTAHIPVIMLSARSPGPRRSSRPGGRCARLHQETVRRAHARPADSRDLQSGGRRMISLVSFRFWMLAGVTLAVGLALMDTSGPLIGLGISFTLLFMGTTGWMAFGLMQQLRAAAATARAIAAGDSSARVPETGPPELRELAASINQMGQAIATRDQRHIETLHDADSGRDLFYAIINATSDGLLVYDSKQERVTAVNDRCAQLFGFRIDEILQTSLCELQQHVRTRCEHPDRYAEQLSAHFARPEGHHQDLVELRHPVRRVIRQASSPLIRGCTLAGRVFTYTDVTREVELDRLKSEFVSMASHELRTPLTSLHGALQLALAGATDRLAAEDRELLDISVKSTDRLVRLVDDLLDLSKIEAGRMPFATARLDLADLLREAAQTMEGLAHRRQARIVIDVPSDLPAVSGDRDHLMRVVTNLVSNALKYSEASGEIVLSACWADAGVRVSVQDDGPGIPADQVDRLFRPFSRVGVHERQTTGGTGLGLAISRAIVEQHGGRIWLEPAQPRGARFVFELPTDPAAMERAA